MDVLVMYVRHFFHRDTIRMAATEGCAKLPWKQSPEREMEIRIWICHVWMMVWSQIYHTIADRDDGVTYSCNNGVTVVTVV